MFNFFRRKKNPEPEIIDHAAQINVEPKIERDPEPSSPHPETPVVALESNPSPSIDPAHSPLKAPTELTLEPKTLPDVGRTYPAA